MLQTVSIQNFKSLRDVTLKLQPVTLLIGPNNSGKSNFLKALTMVREYQLNRIQLPFYDLKRVYHKQWREDELPDQYPMKFAFRWDYSNRGVDSYAYQLELLGYDHEKNLLSTELIGCSENKIPVGLDTCQLHLWVANMYEFYVRPGAGMDYLFRDKESRDIATQIWNEESPNSIPYFKHGKYYPINLDFSHGKFIDEVTYRGGYFSFDLSELFSTMRIFSPGQKISGELTLDKHIMEDGSNLVAFLDNIRDEHSTEWKAIERDLNRCIPEFEGIDFRKVQVGNAVQKRFGLRDTAGKTFWADELSEGTIYFLILLAIIHQPHPPKVLLLEEPEKGIHPRRIAEVMELIFRLAEEKQIQIILSSHSTQVVDAFQEMPESVFVFDMVDGETKVNNLADIIDADTKESEIKGFPKIDFKKRTLSENWQGGFIGGVPVS